MASRAPAPRAAASAIGGGGGNQIERLRGRDRRNRGGLNPQTVSHETAPRSHGVPSMATSYDLDPEPLISRLAGPLLPADRQAFRAAALDALTRVPCWGEGAVYRAVAALQRQYFHPPAEWATNQPQGSGSKRPSKLSNEPPIGADDPRVGGRDRRRLKVVG